MMAAIQLGYKKKVKVQKHTCQCMVQENVETLQSR